jgi:carbamoyltransferase
LLKDGKIVAATEEERFTRVKHDASFPINAINYCLESQNINIDDVEYIGFYEKPILKLERVLSQHLEMFPLSLKTFLSTMPSWINQKTRIIKTIRKELKYKKDILFIEHHLAHAASSFLVSPFNKSAIVTIDGVGEWTTTTFGIGKDNNIQLMKEIRFPHSIGLLYSAITAYLGFEVNNSEYKVMGLSAYGDMKKSSNRYYKKLRQVIDTKKDGSYRLNMDYFAYLYKDSMPSKKLCELLGGPVRKPESELTERHQNIAAALQLIYEDVFFKILNHTQKEMACENVVIAGGCGLNSVANGKVLSNSRFKKVWIQPNSSDGGASIGVASYIYHTVLNHKRQHQLRDVYLGPEFSTKQVKSFLDNNRIKYTKFRDKDDTVKSTAKLIYENNVIGWFQGRMEFGPRALGARSILSNPCNPKMQEILNLKVKHRETFRPFAPAVCSDDALKYFECDKPIPPPTDFMLMVYPVRKKYRKIIPSVTHVDGSGRLQTISRSQNQDYYDLIKEFGKLSGIPILVNTSFNIRGEPIVCTPYDAYKCIMGTDIDYLVMDNFLIKRNDNRQDMWDNEVYTRK